MTSTGDQLGEAPPFGAPLDELRAFLTLGYGCPDGYYVDRVVRYGGRDGTGLDVLITPPGGGHELRISYERESDCTNPTKLRARAVAATNGLTRASRITSQRAALAMYEALCTLASAFTAADEHGQTWEWLQELRRRAAQTLGSHEDYWALRRLREHEYSKALVTEPPHDTRGKPQRANPLLLVEESGEVYVTARHLAVFLRHDLGVEDAGSDDRILTRLLRIGGERLPMQVWDRPGRDRTDKVDLVLYRLPREAPDDVE